MFGNRKQAQKVSQTEGFFGVVAFVFILPREYNGVSLFQAQLNSFSQFSN